MAAPVPLFRPPPLPEPVPVVRLVEREDELVLWARPLFRAPVLEVIAQLFEPDDVPNGFSPPPSGTR
jgi:hypothetical protein